MLPITPFPNGVAEDSHQPTKERVRALLEQGFSVTEIAALGKAIDSRFARRYDWTEIAAYYEAGYSMKEYRQRFGFCGAVARRDLSLELHHVNGDGMDNRLENPSVAVPQLPQPDRHLGWACPASCGVASGP